MAAGYNPYRKANGEFATKEEAGAQAEKDFRMASHFGDEQRIAEIETYVMENMDDTPLGQYLLDKHYGDSSSVTKERISSEDMAIRNRMENSPVNGFVDKRSKEEKRAAMEKLKKLLG